MASNATIAEEFNQKRADQDVFGGRPDNPLRVFYILQDLMSGIGHTALADSLPGKNQKKILKEQRKDQRIHQFATSSLIAHLNAQLDNIQKMWDAFKKDAEEVKNEINSLKKQVQDAVENGAMSKEDAEVFIEGIDDLEKRIEITDQNIIDALNTKKEATKDILDRTRKIEGLKIGEEHAADFFKNTAKIVEQYVVLELDLTKEGLEKKAYVISQDANGYFVTDPQIGRIDINEHLNNTQKELAEMMANDGAKFANDPSATDAEQLQSRLNTWYDNISKTENEHLKQYLTGLTEAYKDIKEADLRLDILIKEREGLKQELEELKSKLSCEINGDYCATANDIAERQKAIEAELSSIQQDRSEAVKNFESILDQIDKARNNLAEEKREHSRAKELETVIDDNLKKYASRHEQIEETYGSGFEKWIKEHTIFDGEKSARFYAWANNLIGRESDTVKAWENSIQHNGQHVYRDNKTGELYTYNEKSEQRSYIKDPAVIRQLYDEAYNKVRLFRNETPYSKDPNNQFEDTLKSIKELEKHNIKKHAEKNVTKAQKQKVEEAQQEVNRLEKLKEEHGVEAEPAKKNGTALKFSAAATPDTTQQEHYDVAAAQPTQITGNSLNS